MGSPMKKEKAQRPAFLRRLLARGAWTLSLMILREILAALLGG